MSNRQTLLTAYNTVKQVVHHDAMRPDDLIIETIEDCEPIIERARILSELSPRKGELFRHVGIAPDFICAKALREKWDNADWDKFLNDSNYEKFRTWKGRV